MKLAAMVFFFFFFFFFYFFWSGGIKHKARQRCGEVRLSHRHRIAVILARSCSLRPATNPRPSIADHVGVWALGTTPRVSDMRCLSNRVRRDRAVGERGASRHRAARGRDRQHQRLDGAAGPGPQANQLIAAVGIGAAGAHSERIASTTLSRRQAPNQPLRGQSGSPHSSRLRSVSSQRWSRTGCRRRRRDGVRIDVALSSGKTIVAALTAADSAFLLPAGGRVAARGTVGQLVESEAR